MSSTVLRALLLDAFHQVVDNKIFRALLLLVAFVVLASFLIGFRETEIQVVFGMWSVSYADLFHYFSAEIPAGVDVQGTVVQLIQAGLVEGLCGNLGMTVCLAATAFFVPRMLEKGAADIVFAKPVSRWALLFSRYVAGILFVGILSAVLIGGVWLGMLAASGYGDPGFLCGILTLVYLFSMLHAFSLAIGVFTRSTVAALLISVLFFFFSGCVHTIWQVGQWGEDPQVEQLQRGDRARNADGPTPPVPAAQGEEEPQPEAAKHPLLRMLGITVATLHYTLPKTSDADVITAKLRKALATSSSALQDPEAHVTLDPSGDELERLAPPSDAKTVDLSATHAVWIERAKDGSELARFDVSRRARELPPAEPGKRPRRLTSTQAAKEIVKGLGKPPGSVRTDDASIDGTYAQAVRWEEGERWHSVHVLTFGDALLEIRASVPAESGKTRGPDFDSPRVTSFLSGVKLARTNELRSPNEWYKQRFALDAPLRFNVLFSIATTLAFTALMLLCAWWKLRRIDF